MLRQLRRDSKLAQKALVERLHDQGYKGRYKEADISRWEHGRTRPPEDVVEALEDILRAPPGLLLGAAEYYSAAEVRASGQRRQRPESSLMIDIREFDTPAADLEKGKVGRCVAFRLGNCSDNVITVERICLEVLSCESYDLPPPIAAKVTTLKYEIELCPDCPGEYLVTEEIFRYAGPDADDFELLCSSPAGFKYKARLKVYCSDLATAKQFTSHSDAFDLHFYKKTDFSHMIRKVIR